MGTAQKTAAVDLVEELFRSAFDTPRDPRSTEYKAGARAILECRVKGGKFQSPHPMGTAQADAFYSGADEGNQIWRAHVAASSPNKNGA